jgi:SanA protein
MDVERVVGLSIIPGDMKPWQKGCLVALVLGLLLMTSPWLVRSTVKSYYDRRLYAVERVPQRPVAVVFGAAVYGDRLSAVLRDRVETAIDLYQTGQVDRILVSGDNSSDFYDEPGAMRDYAIERGVPPEDILVDPAGHRTYDTCYRARNVYGVESAVLVTQAFHLPRALLTCGGMDIDAVGAVADRRPYRGARWYEMRETAATLVAIWDVLRGDPPPGWEAVIAPG